MASILSFPNEVLELTRDQALMGPGFQRWCKLTSTCRRLWGLQLRDTRSLTTHSRELNIEGKPCFKMRLQTAAWVTMIKRNLGGASWRSHCQSCPGMAWGMKSVQEAPYLEIYIFKLPDKYKD